MKNFDIGKVAFSSLVAIIDQIEDMGDKPHVYVLASERFLKDNPVFKQSVRNADPRLFPTGVVTLNLASSAIRFLNYEGGVMSFTTRVNKVEHQVFIIIGDIVGIGSATPEIMSMIFDPCSLLTSPLVGHAIIRAPDSATLDEVNRHAASPQTELPVDSPEQTPRSRAHLSVVKN